MTEPDLRRILARLQQMERRDRNPPNVIGPSGGHRPFPEPPHQDQGGPHRAPDPDAKPSNVTNVHVHARPIAGGNWVQLDGPDEGFHPTDEAGIRTAIELHRRETYTGDPADAHIYAVAPVNAPPMNSYDPEPPDDREGGHGPSGYVVDHYRPRKALIARDQLGHISIHKPENEAALHQKHPGRYQTKVASLTKEINPFTSGFSEWAQDLFR
jgi:hypothetical protein